MSECLGAKRWTSGGEQLQTRGFGCQKTPGLPWGNKKELGRSSEDQGMLMGGSSEKVEDGEGKEEEAGWSVPCCASLVCRCVQRATGQGAAVGVDGRV